MVFYDVVIIFIIDCLLAVREVQTIEEGLEDMIKALKISRVTMGTEGRFNMVL